MAVALKYDYKLEESNLLFEQLISKGQISGDGLIEYAGTLIKQKNFIRAEGVLNLISPSFQSGEMVSQLKSISSYLQENGCIEYIVDEHSSSTYCFTFDASASADPTLKDLTYIWTFGDDQLKEGIVVDHCFDNSGTHLVKLGSVDPITNIKNSDTTFIVSIKPPLNFNQMLKNNIVKKSINFEYKEELPQGTSLLWHFGNGIFKSGTKVDFTFNRPGNYYIEFFLISDDMAQSSLYCNSCQFFVNKNRSQQREQ